MKERYNNPRLIFCLLTAWMAAVTLEYVLLPKPARSLAGFAALTQISGLRVTIVAVFLFLLLRIGADYLPRPLERWLPGAAFALYASSALPASFSWAFCGACVLTMLVLAVYGAFGWDGSEPAITAAPKERAVWPILTWAAGVGFFCLVSAWGVARVRSFSAPTFDFGIFSQMFHYMNSTGRQLTTVERDGLLSHFAVHVSPIYYLMLPFYRLFPRPETLQVLQAAVLASALVPLWKLGRVHGLHPAARTAVCILLLLYPAYAGGTGYDLHENCFLTPLILWLLYGIDKKSLPLTVVSAVLTWFVKEDAPVYAAVIGLYLLVRAFLRGDQWGIRTGGGLLAGSIGYFLAVTAWLNARGQGVMNYRYSNFMYDGSNSLLTVVKAVLLCPMKAIFECMDGEKLTYIGLTMVPLLGLPLLTRRYERFLLLIPYLLVNLMSDYRYQHDIFFQYSFGSTACLFYLVVVNAAELKNWKKAAVLAAALCISFGCFRQEVLPTARRYLSDCQKYSAHYDRQRALLDTIPEDASVAATTFYTSYLSGRSQLYDVRYGALDHILSSEYVVIRVSDAGAFKNYGGSQENFTALLLENGFHLEDQLEGVLEIYKKPKSP